MRTATVHVGLAHDGTRTVAEASLSSPFGEDFLFSLPVTGTGSSAREVDDKPDQRTGDDLALARALRSMAAHLERRANGRIRHAESVKAHRAEIARRKAEEAQGLKPPSLTRALGLPLVQAGKSRSL